MPTQPGDAHTMLFAAVAGWSSPIINMRQSLLRICALMLVVLFIANSRHDAEPEDEKLAIAKPLRFGDTITLRDVYNDYLLCETTGHLHTGPEQPPHCTQPHLSTYECPRSMIKGDADHLEIASSNGHSGPVKYGDTIALRGSNDKYFMVHHSGKVLAATTVLAADTTFKIVGGHGGVVIGDYVAFKSEFGYLHGTHARLVSTEYALKASEKFEVGLPKPQSVLNSLGLSRSAAKHANAHQSWLSFLKHG